MFGPGQGFMECRLQVEQGAVDAWRRPEDVRGRQEGTDAYEGRFERCVRGGSWIYGRRRARCAGSIRIVPDGFNNDLGFRVVSPVLS